MGRFTQIPLPHRQALNATLVYSSRAPEKARRAGMTQAQIDRLEKGRVDAQLGTWRRVFEAMFCELIVVPRALKRPGDAVAEQRLARDWMRPWSPPDRLGR